MGALASLAGAIMMSTNAGGAPDGGAVPWERGEAAGPGVIGTYVIGRPPRGLATEILP
jgi:hypothetical protein